MTAEDRVAVAARRHRAAWNRLFPRRPSEL